MIYLAAAHFLFLCLCILPTSATVSLTKSPELLYLLGNSRCSERAWPPKIDAAAVAAFNASAVTTASASAIDASAAAASAIAVLLLFLTLLLLPLLILQLCCCCCFWCCCCCFWCFWLYCCFFFCFDILFTLGRAKLDSSGKVNHRE